MIKRRLEMKTKAKTEWIDKKTIQEFLSDYDLYYKQESEELADKIAEWICDTINKEDDFPQELFADYEIKSRGGRTYYINVLFDRGMCNGYVILMPDMYGKTPENSPSYNVLDRDLDEDGQFKGDNGPWCPHCGKKLEKSEIEGYVWQCKDCDEDFYDFEVRHEKTETEKRKVYVLVYEDRHNCNTNVSVFAKKEDAVQSVIDDVASSTPRSSRVFGDFEG